MSFLRSTVGKKVVVALTGLILFGFLIGHVAGNLQIFAGPQKINDYGRFLKHATALLWGTRAVLLVAIFFHVWFTVQLNRRNRLSRPQRYASHVPLRSSAASRFMIWSGVVVGAFIIFHLLHFTFGTVHPHFSRENIYDNMVLGFSVWPVALFYIVSMVFIGFHLYHGVFSLFQTLGLAAPKYDGLRRSVAWAFSVLIPLGFISIPVAVLLGFLRL